MTDQIPADKVREIIARHRDGASHRGGMILNDLKALLPLPTLADMAPEERAACQWMQADTNGGRDVISNPCYDQGRATILLRDGTSIPVGMEKITPRPDLPRMEWPGDEKPAPALPAGWRLAKHQTRGPVIVTRPEPDDDGDVCYVAPAVGFMGYVCCFCDPGELTYLDQGADQ